MRARIAVAAAAVLLAGCTTHTAAPGTPVEDDLTGEQVQLIDVVDGDTITVATTAGAVERVRLLGIDTPEAAPPAECWAAEATIALTQLLTGNDGAVVIELVADPMADDRDQYDRLLRYVEVDQVDAGLQLVASGHADLYRDGEGITRTQSYVDAFESAQESATGLWGACD